MAHRAPAHVRDYSPVLAYVPTDALSVSVLTTGELNIES